MTNTELRKTIINALSKVQLENVDARGEAVIQVQAERLLSLIHKSNREYAEGIIGEDEKPYSGHRSGYTEFVNTRNSVRADQRKKLKLED